MKIYVKKKSIILKILLQANFGENPIQHLNDFWFKPIWHNMNCDVTRSTQMFVFFHGFINKEQLFLYFITRSDYIFTVVWVYNTV